MGSKIIDVNTEIYPLDVVYSVAYIFLDKYYIFLDGDPKKSIKVRLTAKDDKADIEEATAEFNNYLVTYSFYKKQSEKNSAIRQLMLQAALFPVEQSAQSIEQNKMEDEIGKIELPEELKDADYLEDPEGIAIPWEVKYKKKKLKG